ncbi:MAG: DedA family protein [Candidatus Sericytochromatia bacterium]|nr:DedA family protein [Candidatus Sericytochromatia bacterium]
MIFESMIAPVPSEAVMPFAGFLIYEGKFSWLGVGLASTLGSIIGSLTSYYIGLYGGKPLVEKFGKYLFLDKHHLELTEKFFAKYGDGAVFFSRFIPVVRHLISVPAGIGEMNIGKFLLYTTIGAGIWNMILTYVGFILKENWNTVKQYTKYGDIFIVLLIVVGLGFFIYKSINKKNKQTS